MSTITPFIRNVELVIGPLTEEEGGGPSSQALRLLSDGGRDSLRISFDVKKTLLSAPNPSTIKVYNLARNTRNKLRRSSTRVQLYVGWANTGRRLLTQGSLINANTVKDGGDTITELKILDGFGGQIRGVSNKTFDRNIPVSEVVRSLAGDMPGISIDEIDVDGTTGFSGLTVSGRTSEEIDKLSESYGFSWSVQNGQLQAVQDTRAIDQSGRVVISNELRNLVTADPILDGPMQIETGVNITALLDPRVRPGVIVGLQSAFNPRLNGNYKTFLCDFAGDTNDTKFEMKITSYKGF